MAPGEGKAENPRSIPDTGIESGTATISGWDLSISKCESNILTFTAWRDLNISEWPPSLGGSATVETKKQKTKPSIHWHTLAYQLTKLED